MKFSLPSRLPSNYQEVAYIDGWGSQYIKTGIVTDITAKYEITAMFYYFESYYSDEAIFGTTTMEYLVNHGWLNNSEHTHYYRRNYSTGEVYITMDGSVIYNTPDNNKQSEEIYLFATNHGGTPVQYSLYSFVSMTIKENDVLIADYVPCYRKSDGEIGLYDLVTKTFLTNDGTGAFTKGADDVGKSVVDISLECGETIPEQFQRVDYIRSDEVGYVPSGWSLNGNTSLIEVYTEFAIMNTYSDDACAFGNDGSAFSLKEGFNSGELGEVEVNVGEYHTYYYKRDWVNETTYYEIDGIPVRQFSASYKRTEQYAIFSSYWSGSPFRFTDLKMKYFKLYQNGVLVRDLVPCYQIINNAIGMYDYVMREFHGNSSSGFTKGNDSSVKDIRTNHVKRIADGNGNVIWNKLPDEYQEVEYIGSTGTQYIATPLNVYKDDTVETEFAFDCTDPHDHYLISTYPWGGGYAEQRFAMGVYDYGWAAGRFTGVYGAQGTSATYLEPSEDYDHDFHRWRFSNKTFYLDDDKIRDCSWINYTSYPTNTLYIFYSVSSVTAGRLKNYRQWHDRQLVADFIPCYRKSDSVIGLYDLVTGTFFTNAGSGTFTKGNDI